MFNTMNDTGLTPQLRTAIRESRLSGYRLARLAGVSESSISRFMRGRCGLSLQAIDRIWHVLDLHVSAEQEGHNGITLQEG